MPPGVYKLKNAEYLEKRIFLLFLSMEKENFVLSPEK